MVQDQNMQITCFVSEALQFLCHYITHGRGSGGRYMVARINLKAAALMKHGTKTFC